MQHAKKLFTRGRRWTSGLALYLLLAPFTANAAKDSGLYRQSMKVIATAYTSHHAQTDKTPYIGAWGDHLGKQKIARGSIAVSPDLLRKGLRRGQRVRIEGVKGDFVVLDKTPQRWRNRIDIYMGADLKKARRWGKRRVTIVWDPVK